MQRMPNVFITVLEMINCDGIITKKLCSILKRKEQTHSTQKKRRKKDFVLGALAESYYSLDLVIFERANFPTFELSNGATLHK
jgi:hypothetical protein